MSAHFGFNGNALGIDELFALPACFQNDRFGFSVGLFDQFIEQAYSI